VDISFSKNFLTFLICFLSSDEINSSSKLACEHTNRWYCSDWRTEKENGCE